MLECLEFVAYSLVLVCSRHGGMLDCGVTAFRIHYQVSDYLRA